MSPFIPVDEAEIVSLFLETLIYGLFIALWTISVVLIFRRGEDGRAQRRLLPIGFLMIAGATSHILVDVVRLVQAFVTVPQAGGAIAYYHNVKNPLHITKTALYVSQTLLGDGILIWRCYIVWQKRLRVLLPLVAFWIATACCGYAISISFAVAAPGTTVFSTALNWVTSFGSLTAAINIICTSAIAYRIWSTGTLSQWQGSTSLWPIFVVVIETGMLYTAAILAFLITYLAGSNGQYIALDMMAQIVGVSFCLIVLQTQLQVYSRTEPMSTIKFVNGSARIVSTGMTDSWTKNATKGATQQTQTRVPAGEA
ncbi:hypothetical protein EVG20_g8730 [Dentipellis fragilis]|uniref:Uncharacterized protein n=1 Tax=Dentipellis fragilis TaxID=205917 RepID=A0A4Y9Y391_9AGAM|nr:hypothetical protein EVG20_g8730 [Dentipellis fragilis]